jgi:hypothetical protein
MVWRFIARLSSNEAKNTLTASSPLIVKRGINDMTRACFDNALVCGSANHRRDLRTAAIVRDIGMINTVFGPKICRSLQWVVHARISTYPLTNLNLT